MKADPKNFYAVVTEAVVDILDHGFDNFGRVEKWQKAIERAARATLKPEREVDEDIRNGLNQVYERLVNSGEIARHHPSLAIITINDLKPQMRKELDKFIHMNADLVKRKRATAIDQTLSRFAGWASSVPAGGTKTTTKGIAGAEIKKALKSLTFEDRRLMIDQGHKLTAAINEVVAKGGGAIAGRWRSNWRQPGYDYREEHRDRDGRVYLLRESWAKEQGLVRPGNNGYYDQITRVGEEPFCRCQMVWLYHLRDLPADMLTAKGKSELARVQALLAQ